MSKSLVAFSWELGLEIAELFIELHMTEIQRVSIVGSVGRREAKCHDVDLLIIPRPGVIFPKPEPPINVFLTTAECWEPALLQYAPTAGSTIGTRRKAKAAGYKLNQYGLFEGDELISQNAREICRLIGCTLSQWVDNPSNLLDWKR